MDEVKRRKHNALVAVVIMVAVLVIIYAGFYTISEQEQAVVTQFGRVVRIESAGAHFRVPFVQRIHRVPTVMRSFHINGANEIGLMITGDYNLIDLGFYVEWRVTDPAKYLFTSDNPRGLLENILLAEARGVVSGFTIDQILTTARPQIQVLVGEQLEARLLYLDLGLIVTSVLIQSANLPTEDVAAAFMGVENARQHRDTLINEALSYANRVVPAARTEADGILREAQSMRDSRIYTAQGQAARFNQLFEGYLLNRDLTRARMYLEAMEEVLPGVRVYIGGSGQ